MVKEPCNTDKSALLYPKQKRIVMPTQKIPTLTLCCDQPRTQPGAEGAAAGGDRLQGGGEEEALPAEGMAADAEIEDVFLEAPVCS